MSAWEKYKPFRNRLSKISRIDSLYALWAHTQFLQFDQPLPADIQTPPIPIKPTSRPSIYFGWQLELLAKEIILNASGSDNKSFKQWPTFADALNRLRDLENGIWGDPEYREVCKKNILMELYRIAHRQFPWQSELDANVLVRYRKIFGQDNLNRIIQEKIGLSTAELYTLGMLFTGHFYDTFNIKSPPTIEVPGLTDAHLEKFLDRFSIDFSTLRTKASESQSYDQDYAYTLNPLRIFPIVRVEMGAHSHLIVPLVPLLIRRFTEGVYYEIFDADGFSSAFGQSFYDYVGEVLAKANKQDAYTYLSEKEYHVGKDRKDSVDWIVSDNSADLFVEVKTKRLRYDAKLKLDSNETLFEDLEKLSNFIAQAYKTLADAQAGHYPHWKPRGKPIYPVILTLEDWYIFGGKIFDALNANVTKKLEANGIDAKVLETNPFAVCCVADFEVAIQVIQQVGIDKFMRSWLVGERRQWILRSVIIDSFMPEANKTDFLFPDEYESIGELEVSKPTEGALS